MENNKKMLFGIIKITLERGNGGYKSEGGHHWYVGDWTVIYKVFGIIFHSITISGITGEQAKNLLK